MRKIREAFRSSALALVIAGLIGVNVIAQEKKQEEPTANIIRMDRAVGTVAPLSPMTVPALPTLPMTSLPFFGRGFAMSSGLHGTVKNAPFSAEMVFESIQTLNDGNRIVHRSSTLTYRDSQGRTRSEHSFKSYFQTGGANVEHKTISIFDPVGGINYTLDPQTRTAHKFVMPQPADFVMPQPANSISAAPALKAGQLPADRVNVAPAPAVGLIKGGPQGKPVIDAACGSSLYSPSGISCKSESLGKQVIEGVEVEGTRTTHTIPAGMMGNERPIESFYERWYSQELQMDVMTKSFDPRSGESTHRLTNLTRSEPDASLFQPPSDYTIREPEALNGLKKEELLKRAREAREARENKNEQND